MFKQSHPSLQSLIAAALLGAAAPHVAQVKPADTYLPTRSRSASYGGRNRIGVKAYQRAAAKRRNQRRNRRACR